MPLNITGFIWIHQPRTWLQSEVTSLQISDLGYTGKCQYLSFHFLPISIICSADALVHSCECDLTFLSEIALHCFISNIFCIDLLARRRDNGAEVLLDLTSFYYPNNNISSAGRHQTNKSDPVKGKM